MARACARSPSRAPTTSSRWSTTSRIRSQPGEVELATELASELAKATADRPAVLPVFVSLTSGDATPEIQAALDAAGGIPLLRGAMEAFSAIARVAWWEGRRAERRADGPWRPGWPALAADRTKYGHDVAAPTSRDRSPGATALPERESLELLRGGRDRRHRRDRGRSRRGRGRGRRGRARMPGRAEARRRRGWPTRATSAG